MNLRSLSLIVFVLFGAFVPDSKAAEFHLSGAAFDFDDDPSIEVTGLQPDSEFVMTLNITDASDVDWFGQSVFRSNAEGRIHTRHHAPVRGMYQGVSASAPFWSMIGGDRFSTHDDANGTVTISSVSGDILARRSFVWTSPRSPDRTRSERINFAGLNTTLYLPAEAQSEYLPIILFGGSGGGTNHERASLLATHGYAVIDVAYFNADGTPDYFLETIPLERFANVIDFVVSDDRLMADRLVLMGRSYGAQLALSLAVYDQRVAGVIVEAPSNMITSTPATYPYGSSQSAWSVNGQPLAYHTGEYTPQSETLIPIEQFGGALLMLSGEEDAIWPATDMAEALSERRVAAGMNSNTKHLGFPDAGHNFGGGEQSYGIPNLPPRNRNGSSGGSVAGNSEAAILAWAATLGFLDDFRK